MSVTLAPIDAADRDIRLLPLDEIGEAFTLPVDTALVLEHVSNVLLFVPFGAALNLRAFSVGKTVLAGGALAAAVELAQAFVVSGRTTSVDDLLLNAVGAVLGHVTLSALLALRENLRGR